MEADAAALFDYLDTIVAAGVDGVVLFGSTGEFVHFSPAERMRVLMLAVKRCRVPLLVNVSHSTLVGALDLAENTIEANVAGLLLMPPYFYRYSEEQIFEFYRQFIAAIDGRAPVYLYNLPQFTNPIPAALANRLLSTGSFAGIKDSGGDWQMFEALQALHTKAPFQLLVGNESLYTRARRLGADGIVSGVAAALPELMVSLDRALREDNLERSRRLGDRVNEFIGWLDQFPATVAIKQAAVVRGWKLDHCAVPCDEHTAAALETFKEWLGDWLPGVLAECAS
jgi:dihydrodipicolinate synthase/N-acetylneuraminate lyase